MSALNSRLNQWIASASNYGRTGATRIDVLDGWRGVAIAVVLLSHFGTFANYLPFDRVLLGRMGVDFFFVLSGLLMSNILFVNRTPLRIFYQRRFTRIIPVFVTFLSVIYAGGWLFKKAEETSNFLYSLFFLRSYIPSNPGIWDSDLPIGHLWSLNVEEHSYIILSLVTLVAALRCREYLALFALGLISISVRYIFIRYPELALAGHEIRTEAAAGPLMLSAGYFLIRGWFVPWVKSWMPVAALIVGVLSYSEYAPWFANWAVAPFMFAFAVNHVQQAPGWLIALFSSRWLRLLGIWSYSIYLWQQPFSHAYQDGVLNFPGNSLVWLALSVAIGLLSFYGLENPVRRYLNDRWEARKTPTRSTHNASRRKIDAEPGE